jgi:hypothetical protein
MSMGTTPETGEEWMRKQNKMAALADRRGGFASVLKGLLDRVDRTPLPFAMASGSVGVGTNGGSSAPIFWDNPVTVTLPVGRFTQPPNVVVTQVAGGSVAWAGVAGAPTTTSFTIRSYKVATYPAGETNRWIAVQMESGSASG